MNPDSSNINPALPKTRPSKSMRKRMLHGIGIMAALLVIYLLAKTIFAITCGGHDMPEAVSNLRQIGMALFEFQSEYDKMPDFDTIAKVRESTGSSLPMGMKSSNDFFRQLFAADMTESEQMFYARISGGHKPDSQISETKTLEKGECGFTYFLGAFKDCNPARPTVVVPMIPGTDRFDPRPFKGKAFVLRADNSVTVLAIDKQGHAIFGGKNLMDPSQPIGEGKPSAIAWPDL